MLISDFLKCALILLIAGNNGYPCMLRLPFHESSYNGNNHPLYRFMSFMRSDPLCQMMKKTITYPSTCPYPTNNNSRHIMFYFIHFYIFILFTWSHLVKIHAFALRFCSADSSCYCSGSHCSDSFFQDCRFGWLCFIMYNQANECSEVSDRQSTKPHSWLTVLMLQKKKKDKQYFYFK